MDMVALRFLTRTGRKVSRPMCRVTKANWTPFPWIVFSKSGVKCSPAVGAAALPFTRA
jgi:hypothetical protein